MPDRVDQDRITQAEVFEQFYFRLPNRYSSRRAKIGSTRVARKAGITVARKAVEARITVTEPKVAISLARIPKSRLDIHCVRAAAPASPAAIPAAASPIPCRITSPTM